MIVSQPIQKIRDRSEPGAEVFDIAIIGGGVVGCAMARRFSLEGARVALIERAPDILDGASKADSAILHTGFDADEDALELACVKARYAEYLEIRESVGLVHERSGALVVAWTKEKLDARDGIRAKAHTNGVGDVEIIGQAALRTREPNLCHRALGAATVPGEGILDPWSAPYAYLGQALANGARLFTSFEVTSGAFDGETWRLRAPAGDIVVRGVINSAGLYGDRLETALLGGTDFNITPRKGQFVVFDKAARDLVRAIILPVPTEGTKGIVVFRTVFGNLAVGPTAEDQQSRTDAATDEQALRALIGDGIAKIPALAEMPVTAVYAGLRPASEEKDYRIIPRPARNWITVGGIRPTGLSGAPGIARLAELTAGRLDPTCRRRSAMTEAALTGGAPIDVAVIGGGPAGLAATTALKAAGVARVVVLEREPNAGGIPRHCGHPPFGLREFGRVLQGPDYAARLVARALRAGVEIHTGAAVIEARPGPDLLVVVGAGQVALSPRRVIYATGVRETPRAARLISGARAAGVLSTGALQSMVYLKGRRPQFRRPVIIGSELVAFSAIMTCRHAGIRPVAMIEAVHGVTARWPAALYPRLAGVAPMTGTRLTEILGERTVRGVIVEGDGGARRKIACDGVVLTDRFIPESSLARLGHLETDPATGGPAVDQWGRCSDPQYFATGNLLRPVETAGWSWREGMRAGQWVADDLAGARAENRDTMDLRLADRRPACVMPKRIAPGGRQGMRALQLRATQTLRGSLTLSQSGRTLWRKPMSTRPEGPILVPISALSQARKGMPVHVEIQ